MRKWRRQITAGLSLACGVMALIGGFAMAAESTDRFDNFRMRQGVPTQLKQVAPDLYFLYDDLSSNSAFLVTDEGVLVIDTRRHPAHGRDLIERIRKITDKPIKWVINTHAHGDHFYGKPAQLRPHRRISRGALSPVYDRQAVVSLSVI